MNFTFQVCTCCDYDTSCRIFSTERSYNSAYSAVFSKNFCNFALFNIQIFLIFADLFHIIMIQNTVSLNTQAMDSRSFAAVQHTALDKAFISRFTHLAAESVDLSNKMPFCSTAN